MTTLEKIRAEIEQIKPYELPCDKRTPERIRDMAVEIVEKYAEQEPTIRPSFSYTTEIKADDEQLERLQGILNGEMVLRLEQEPCEDAVSIDVIIEWLKSKDLIGLSSQEKNARKELQALVSVQTKQECEDAVSRQAVYEILGGNWNTDFLHSEVEQLPSVQPKPIECEDAVSREAVLEIAKQHTLTNDYLAIQSLPPVRPQEPKTGHWITTRTIMHDGEYYCDKCNCDSPHNEKWDYCPNCGARMVEPQESEEV